MSRVLDFRRQENTRRKMEDNNMAKRKILTLATALGVASVLALIIGLASSAGGQAGGGLSERSRHHECSVATLEGVYLFTSREASPSGRPDPNRPFAAAGVRTFDGEGNIRQVATASRNGVISRRLEGTGSYTLDADCTGTMTSSGITQPVHWDIFVATDGSEGVAVRTDEGIISIGTFKKP